MKKFLSIIFVISFMFSSISYTTFAETNQKKHKYEWATTKKATYFKKGSKVYKCSVCNKELKTEVIPKKKLKTPKFKITVDGNKVNLKCYKVKGATQFYVRIFTEEEKLFAYSAREYKYNDKKFRIVNINTKSFYIDKQQYDYILSKGSTYYVRVSAERFKDGKLAQSKWSKKVKVVMK